MKIDSFSKLEMEIIKNALALLMASQRRLVNTATSERYKAAADASLAESKALDAKLSNLELPL